MIRYVLLALLFCLTALPSLAAPQEVRLPDGRSYLIDLPARPQGAPMILALHGGGGNPAQFARSSGLAGPATRQGYAVIFPAGTGRRLLTWNAGVCCGPAARSDVDDLGFLDAVIRDASRRFGLDAGRVYLTGMSNGSMLAELYAARHPSRVRAVAGVAGTLDLAAARPRGPVPLLHIHGTADAMVPYAGGVGPGSLSRTEFSSVDAVIAAFAQAAGRPLAQRQTVIDPADDGMRVFQTDHVGPGGRVMIRLLTVEGGGHAWPGGTRAPRQDGTDDITANAETLRFFALHP